MSTQRSPLTRIARLALGLLLVAACFDVGAQVPDQINYQGLLTDSGGHPISATVSMTFKLYNVSSGGAALYTEAQSVTVANGIFNVAIGSITPLNLPFDVPYFLGITVGADAEMTPRQAVLSSPYALRAGKADGLSGAGTVDGNIVLAESTASTVGNVFKGANSFIHNFGSGNVFVGENSGNFTMTGGDNVGAGSSALAANTSGNFGIAIGFGALNRNTSGGNNIAIGTFAMTNNLSGGNNVAIGFDAGAGLITGSNNIYLATIGLEESSTIRIGTFGNQDRAFIAGISGVTTALAGVPVLVDANGQLGTISSSSRFKDDIADMGERSSVLMRLRPVTFYYKAHAASPERTLQYGLVAEEVQEVAPGLVAHSATGAVETVYYQFLAPMLLNEYQKQQRTIEAQAALLSRQSARIAELEHDRQAQVARIDALEERAAEISVLEQRMAQLIRLYDAGTPTRVVDSRLGTR
jgi:hypothetical protein